MSNETSKIKPFSMVLSDDDIRAVEGDEGITKRKEALEKPFIIDETMIQEKEYLLLLVFTIDNYEDEKTFEFITGTTVDVYKFIKDQMANDNESCLDIKKSFVIVDSPKVSISKRITIYKFMKNALVTGKVIDDSGFNIDEFYYKDSDEEIEEE